MTVAERNVTTSTKVVRLRFYRDRDPSAFETLDEPLERVPRERKIL